MHDDQWGEQQLFDFDEFANHIVEQGLQVSPAEIHGCVTGLLASGAEVDGELALAALTDALGLEVHGELAEEVMRLYGVTGASLAGDEFDFYPLMPDDEVDIAERGSALAGWCRSFLEGFAQGSAGVSQSTLTEDSGEVLKDLLAFAELEVEEESEEAEGNYTEIVEYLRVAVLNVYMDSQADKASGGDKESPAT